MASLSCGAWLDFGKLLSGILEMPASGREGSIEISSASSFDICEDDVRLHSISPKS